MLEFKYTVGDFLRVSIGLTVSRKTAKNLAVRRKNERILTVSLKKTLTVKKSNHKIRSRRRSLFIQRDRDLLSLSIQPSQPVSMKESRKS